MLETPSKALKTRILA